ncbi:MAG: hypothetical protein ACSLFD_01775 [Solirubrobacterales bacterium]
MKLKLTLATVLAATLVAIAGCGGGDDSSSTDEQQDIDEITALVADINAASKSKDALAACGLMQPSGVTEVFNTQSQCVRETKKVLAQNSGDDPVLKADDIVIEGETAKVTFENNAGGAPIELVKEGGKWYVPLSSTEATPELQDEQ